MRQACLRRPVVETLAMTYRSSALKRRVCPSSKTPDSRATLQSSITERILRELEHGVVPWVRPWGSGTATSVGIPRNGASGRAYSGINILLLWNAAAWNGFGGHNWLTFRQALELGGHVRRGENGTTAVYADTFVLEAEKLRAAQSGEEPHRIGFLKRFTLFHVDQCEGLPDTAFTKPMHLEEAMIAPRVKALLSASGADIRITGDQAYYAVNGDFIVVPPVQMFHDPNNWPRTALHELSHWSGAKHRLNRDLSGKFGSELYAREELVAELSAAFVCAELGIVPTVRHADYIGAWMGLLRKDERAIIKAASLASKAANFLMDFDRQGTPRPDPQDAEQTLASGALTPITPILVPAARAA